MDQKYQNLFERLKHYMELSAISRFEETIVDNLKLGIKVGSFEISRDKLGSVIFYKKSKS